MTTADRKPSLAITPDQFPFDPDPEQAAREWAKLHGQDVEESRDDHRND